MAKTKEVKVSPIITPEVTSTPSPVKVEKKVISKVEYDFGRGDLNSLRDKLNEVIDKLNGN